jgi:hypothetical protein
LRLQSQGDQDLCAAAAAEHLIFKTSTEEQTVDLTNKDMPKDSQRFLRWFHSAWRTTYVIIQDVEVSNEKKYFFVFRASRFIFA